MSANAKLETAQENEVDQWNTHTFYVLFAILHPNTMCISLGVHLLHTQTDCRTATHNINSQQLFFLVFRSIFTILKTFQIKVTDLNNVHNLGHIHIITYDQLFLKNFWFLLQVKQLLYRTHKH
jgi:hypothetical protein